VMMITLHLYSLTREICSSAFDPGETGDRDHCQRGIGPRSLAKSAVAPNFPKE